MPVRTCVAALGLLGAAMAPVITGAAEAPLPPMSYYSSVDSDALKDILRGNPAFANLEPQLYGSPISLRITHSFAMTSGGTATGLMSAVLAGGTLGLLPAVTNNDLTVTYDIVVHGRPIATWTYQRNLTRVFNLWSKDATQGLGEDGLKWLHDTAAQFTAAAVQDPRILELKREYDLYFGAPETPSAPGTPAAAAPAAATSAPALAPATVPGAGAAAPASP